MQECIYMYAFSLSEINVWIPACARPRAKKSTHSLRHQASKAHSHMTTNQSDFASHEHMHPTNRTRSDQCETMDPLERAPPSQQQTGINHSIRQGRVHRRGTKRVPGARW
jgi:hypothetical protein